LRASGPRISWLRSVLKPSDRAIAAVDQMIAAGDETGLIRQQEGCQGRNFLGTAKPPLRMHRDQLVARSLVKARQKRRVDEGRADGIHPDALFGMIDRGGLGQPDHGMFGRHIGGCIGKADIAQN